MSKPKYKWVQIILAFLIVAHYFYMAISSYSQDGEICIRLLGRDFGSLDMNKVCAKDFLAWFIIASSTWFILAIHLFCKGIGKRGFSFLW